MAEEMPWETPQTQPAQAQAPSANAMPWESNEIAKEAMPWGPQQPKPKKQQAPLGQVRELFSNTLKDESFLQQPSTPARPNPIVAASPDGLYMTRGDQGSHEFADRHAYEYASAMAQNGATQEQIDAERPKMRDEAFNAARMWQINKAKDQYRDAGKPGSAEFVGHFNPDPIGVYDLYQGRLLRDVWKKYRSGTAEQKDYNVLAHQLMTVQNMQQFADVHPLVNRLAGDASGLAKFLIAAGTTGAGLGAAGVVGGLGKAAGVVAGVSGIQEPEAYSQLRTPQIQQTEQGLAAPGVPGKAEAFYKSSGGQLAENAMLEAGGKLMGQYGPGIANKAITTARNALVGIISGESSQEFKRIAGLAPEGSQMRALAEAKTPEERAAILKGLMVDTAFMGGVGIATGALESHFQGKLDRKAAVDAVTEEIAKHGVAKEIAEHGTDEQMRAFQDAMRAHEAEPTQEPHPGDAQDELAKSQARGATFQEQVNQGNYNRNPAAVQRGSLSTTGENTGAWRRDTGGYYPGQPASENAERKQFFLTREQRRQAEAFQNIVEHPWSDKERPDLAAPGDLEKGGEGVRDQSPEATKAAGGPGASDSALNREQLSEQGKTRTGPKGAGYPVSGEEGEEQRDQAETALGPTPAPKHQGQLLGRESNAGGSAAGTTPGASGQPAEQPGREGRSEPTSSTDNAAGEHALVGREGAAKEVAGASSQGYGQNRPRPQTKTAPSGYVSSGDVPNEEEVAKTVEQKLDLHGRRGGTGGQLGLFQVEPELARRVTGNIGVQMHEYGHGLEAKHEILDSPELDVFGTHGQNNQLAGQQLLNAARLARDEMVANATSPAQARRLANMPLTYEEGFAEFFRHHTTTNASPGLFGDANGQSGVNSLFGDWLNAHPGVKSKLGEAQSVIDRNLHASAEERLKANILPTGEQPKPQDQSSAERRQTFYTKIKNFVNDISQLWENDNTVMKVTETAGGKKASAQDGLAAFVTAVRDAPPRWARDSLTGDGLYNPVTGDKLAGNYGDEVLKIAGVDSPEKEANFNAYSIAAHTLDEMSRGLDPLNGKYTQAELRDIVQKLETPEFKSGQAARVAWRNKIIDLMTNLGMMTSDERDAIQQAHPNHVPLRRVVEGDEARGYKSFQDTTGLMKRAGSDRPIISPVDSDIAFAMESMGNIGRHLNLMKLYREAYGDMANGIPGNPAAARLLTEVQEGDKVSPGMYRASIIVDGGRKTFEVDPKLNAWAGEVPHSFIGPVADSLLRNATWLRKAGWVIYNTGFAMRRMMYDLRRHLLYRRDAAWTDPAVGFAQALKDRVSESDPFFQMAIKDGVRHSVAGDFGSSRPENIDNVRGDLFDAVLGRRPWNAERMASLLTEAQAIVNESFRYGEYRRGLEKQGYTAQSLGQMLQNGQMPPLAHRIEAINNMQEVFHNYRQMGSKVRELNQFIPLLASSLYTKVDPIRQFARDPKTVGLRMAGLNLAAGSLAAFMATNYDEYRNADRKLKATHIAFPNPFYYAGLGGKLLWLPFGHGGAEAPLSMVVSNAVNAVAEGDTKQISAALKEGAVQSLRTPVEPSLVGTAMDLMSGQGNRGPIVPPQMEPGGYDQRLPADRYRPDETSELAKAAGGATGTSPAKWQYGAENLTGGLGTRAELTAEQLAKGQKVSPVNYPFLGGMFRKRESDQASADFWDRYNELKQTEGSAKARGMKMSRDDRVEQAKLELLKPALAKMEKLAEEGSELQKDRKGKTSVKEQPALERTKVAGQDWQESIGRNKTGLARFATGKTPLAGFPNPLSAAPKTLHNKAQAISDDALAKIVSDTFPARAPTDKDELEQWQIKRSAAQSIIDGLKLSPERLAEIRHQAFLRKAKMPSGKTNVED
jgi:hypothetical protein